MAKQFNWTAYEGGYRCTMANDVTLVVTPERYAKGFTPKAARGARWHAQASQWDGKSTISRFGRDEYGNTQASAKDAMRLAESIYLEAVEG